MFFKYFFWIYYLLFTWSRTLAYENIPVTLYAELLIELWACSLEWKTQFPSFFSSLLGRGFGFICRILPCLYPYDPEKWTGKHSTWGRWKESPYNDPSLIHSLISPRPYLVQQKFKSWLLTNRQSGRSYVLEQKKYIFYE